LENTSNNKIFCQDCGSQIDGSAGFCTFCGTRQSRKDAGPVDDPAVDDSNAPTLVGDAMPPVSVSGDVRAAAVEEKLDEVAGEPVAEPESVKDDYDYSLEPATLISHAYIPMPSAELPEKKVEEEPSVFDTRDTSFAGTESDFESTADDMDIEPSIDFGGDINSESDAAKAIIDMPSIEAPPIEEPSVELPVAETTQMPTVEADPNANTLEDVEAIAEKLHEVSQPEPAAEPITGEVDESVAQLAAKLRPAPEEKVLGAQPPPAPEFLKEDAGPEKKLGEDEQTYTSQIDKPETTGGRKLSKQAQTLTEGTLLNNRYEIVRKIGGGGMGAVYLASDRNLGGVSRAVKEMVQSHIEPEQQEKALADFKRESLLLTSLEHPCIPTIYDYFYDENSCRFYLVMKYISGGDLAARLKAAPDGRVDEKSVTEWAAQTADVLDYLHSRRPPIVYRDLKPSNLMIDGNTGRIMMIDFGIARWVTKNEKDVTAVGTMGYAPPELFSGNVEPRSDIYSLGATMFHLLTGADPQSNPLLIFDFTKHPRPRQVNPAVSNEMEQILMRTVEYNVELRYSSAAELREALITHLERLRYGQVSYHNNAPPLQPMQHGHQASMSGQSSGHSMVFCGFCGEKILGNDVFCPFCGAKQNMGDQQHQALHFQSPGNSRSLAKVTVLGTGELAPPTFNLEKPNNIVGRRDPQTNIFPEVDLSKYDPQTKISRRHARIWKEGETFLVEDLGSSNGTVIVSNQNVALKLPPHQPHVLPPNSKLVVGDTTLHFVVGG
jgi:serine/threonine-protein kinase